MRSPLWLALLAFGLACSGMFGPEARSASAGIPAPVVSFNRDVRPILAENCYACHGPDRNKRKAGLRLDTREGAFAERGQSRPLVPGKPQDSELYRRISAEDDEERMPPARFGKKLSPPQIAIIRTWIEQGAHWQKHWSLIPAQRSPLPEVGQSTWPRNAIDHFILSALQREGLNPSAEADRRTLIRRLSFDLTGLPPTPEEVDAFERDQSPGAYERLVDRLLASPHHGERMALYWLDLARYADTGGYHSDNHRDVYLYRDYVIRAFNSNKPFDGFTIEQRL